MTEVVLRGVRFDEVESISNSCVGCHFNDSGRHGCTYAMFTQQGVKHPGCYRKIFIINPDPVNLAHYRIIK